MRRGAASSRPAPASRGPKGWCVVLKRVRNLLRAFVLWLVGSWATGCQFQLDGGRNRNGNGKGE